jgi:hypothetical protein
MTVTWLFFKRQELYSEILLTLAPQRPSLTPRGVASMIGKLRSASLVAMWGPYLTYGLHWGRELTILEPHLVKLQFGHLCRIM